MIRFVKLALFYSPRACHGIASVHAAPKSGFTLIWTQMGQRVGTRRIPERADFSGVVEDILVVQALALFLLGGGFE